MLCNPDLDRQAPKRSRRKQNTNPKKAKQGRSFASLGRRLLQNRIVAGLQNLGLRAEGLGLHKRFTGFHKGLRFRAGGFGSGFTAWSRLSPLSGEDFIETSRQRVRAGGVVSVEIREVEYI